MLSTDEPIILLIEKLDALPRGDRAAILKRLSPRQRERIASLRAGHRVPSPSGFSQQLAERIEQIDSDQSPLTPMARDALRRAITTDAPAPKRSAARGSSLADAAAGLLRNRTRQ